MTFILETFQQKTVRLMETRNCQSNALVDAAETLRADHPELEAAAEILLHQATEIDLSNLATEILYSYPQAHTIVLLEDQRTGYEDVIFCGHIDDEHGNKIEDSFKAKEFVERIVAEYRLAKPKSVVERVINLREYAARTPKFFPQGNDEEVYFIP